MSLIFVDCEAAGGAPSVGQLTEIGAVEFKTKETFYARICEFDKDPNNPAIPIARDFDEDLARHGFLRFKLWLQQFPGRPVFVSDNPAYDWQWVNDGFHKYEGFNPFGFSARRIGDFYAGLKGDFYTKQDWKRLRKTKHTHDPVDDAMGNVEAFERLLKGEAWK